MTSRHVACHRDKGSPTEHGMGLDDLKFRYQELRDALELAYLAPVWDAQHIDRLTDHIRSVELALGLLQGRRGDDHGTPARSTS